MGKIKTHFNEWSWLYGFIMLALVGLVEITYLVLTDNTKCIKGHYETKLQPYSDNGYMSMFPVQKYVCDSVLIINEHSK